MRIDFLHPVFRYGEDTFSRWNSTVRRGERNIAIEEKVELYETGSDTPLAKGVVTNTIVTQLSTVYLFPQLIEYQHDEETQKFSGLMKAMDRAYPGILPSEKVTIIYFLLEE
jgi:hypothetical protein